MRRQHVILANAKHYPVGKSVENPLGATYNYEAGYWMKDGEILMHSESGPKPGSKKFDVETGEDQKGE